MKCSLFGLGLVFFLFLLSDASFSQGSGNALDFDGTNDNVEIRNTFTNQNGTTSFSFCAWIMSTNVGKAGQRVLCDDQQTSGSGGYALSLGDPGSGRLRFYCRALSSVSLDVTNSNYYLSNNIWYHVAAVYNQATRTRQIYVNGELAATTTHSAGEWTTSEVDNGPVTIGGESNGSSESSNRFQGRIDEVSYWSKALTQTEIRDLMCRSLAGSESNLLGYWNFDGAATGANNVPDITGNNFTGTMRNMTAGDVVLSSAPIGNTSVYNYTTTWGGVSLTHSSPEGDSLTVSSVSSATVNCVHIYHVESVPNTLAGVTGIGGNDHYYGVFKSTYNGGSGTYTATYHYGENDAYQNSTTADPDYIESNLRVFTRSNNSSTPWTMETEVPDTGLKTITMTANSTEFILAYVNGLAMLPIELLSFEARPVNEKVELSWCTASEINNAFFTVERSMDGVSFSPLAQIPGAGNSNSLLCYSAEDTQPVNGISYYRLKQTDFDGTKSYSDIRIVNLRKDELSVFLYPNPANDFTGIVSNVANFQLEIIDMNGKKVLVDFSDSNSYSLSVSSLPEGIYTLRIISGSEFLTHRLVISR